MEQVGSGAPHTTVEPSGGVVGLIPLDTDEGRCPLDNPCEMLMKASLLLLVLLSTSVVVLVHPVVRYEYLHLIVKGFGCCGKSAIDSTRNLASCPLCN